MIKKLNGYHVYLDKKIKYSDFFTTYLGISDLNY